MRKSLEEEELLMVVEGNIEVVEELVLVLEKEFVGRE